MIIITAHPLNAGTASKLSSGVTWLLTRNVRFHTPVVKQVLRSSRVIDGAAPPGTWPTHYGRVPPRCPELPSTAHDRHQQQPANMNLARASNRRATHRDTLVMRRSSGPTEVQIGASREPHG
jgi:hypothetical protein